MKKLVVMATAMSLLLTSATGFAANKYGVEDEKTVATDTLTVTTPDGSVIPRQYVNVTAKVGVGEIAAAWNEYMTAAKTYAKEQLKTDVTEDMVTKVVNIDAKFTITVTAPDLETSATASDLTITSEKYPNFSKMFVASIDDAKKTVTYTFDDTDANKSLLANYFSTVTGADTLTAMVPARVNKSVAGDYPFSIALSGKIDLATKANAKIGTIVFNSNAANSKLTAVMPTAVPTVRPTPTVAPTVAPTTPPAVTPTPTPKPSITIKLDDVLGYDSVIKIELDNDYEIEGEGGSKETITVDKFTQINVDVTIVGENGDEQAGVLNTNFTVTLKGSLFKKVFAYENQNIADDERVTLTQEQYDLIKNGYGIKETKNDETGEITIEAVDLSEISSVDSTDDKDTLMSDVYKDMSIESDSQTKVNVSAGYTTTDSKDVTLPHVEDKVEVTPAPSASPTPSTEPNPGGSGSGGGGGSVRPTATPTATATPAPTAEPGATATPAPAADAVTATRTEVDPTTGETKTVTVTFNDVKTSDWFAESVKKAFAMGIMNGTSDTEFSPNLTTTRGMIITVVSRLNGGATATEATNFADVAADQYYADAVKWGAANGIVKGYDENTFAPNDDITREQFAAIFYRYAQFKGYDVSAAGDISKFADADKVSDYAKTAIAWANGIGLMNGTDDNRLMPTDKALRCQVAKMIVAFDEWVASQAPKAE